MRNQFKAFIFFAVAIVVMFQMASVPILVYAQSVQSPQQTNNIQSPSGSTIGIQNPIKATSIECLISQALGFVVNLLAIAAVLYIMWAGFLFVKAQGNEEELKKAKKSLMNALIGTALVLGAWALASVIANTVNKISNGSVTLPSQNSCQ